MIVVFDGRKDDTSKGILNSLKTRERESSWKDQKKRVAIVKA